MKLSNACLLTLGLFFACVFIKLKTHHEVTWYVTFATSLWAAVDSSRIQLKRYRTGVGPVVFFFLCLLCWSIGFTWYLWMRHKILTGTAELKTNDPRCVSCEEMIEANTVICPKCGWRQPG